MFRPHRHLIWLVFFFLVLTASLPWWSHVPFTTLLTLQTAALVILAFIWLIFAWWLVQTNMYTSFVISLSWPAMILDQCICMVVLAGAIWGVCWVSGFSWPHLSPIAHLLFLLLVGIGSIVWFIEWIVIFWVPLAYDLGELAIAHYSSRLTSRRRRRRGF